MKVINRSDGTVVYSLPEYHVRRVFNLGESKDIPEEEINALWQDDGGNSLIRNELIVQDEEWVNKNMPNAPIEYFWTVEDVDKCIKEDSLELFEETLEYAPTGVIDLIKSRAWQLPMTDLNKVDALEKKTGFNALKAIEVMKKPEGVTVTAKPKERLRKREG